MYFDIYLQRWTLILTILNQPIVLSEHNQLAPYLGVSAENHVGGQLDDPTAFWTHTLCLGEKQSMKTSLLIMCAICRDDGRIFLPEVFVQSKNRK